MLEKFHIFRFFQVDRFQADFSLKIVRISIRNIGIMVVFWTKLLLYPNDSARKMYLTLTILDRGYVSSRGCSAT